MKLEDFFYKEGLDVKIKPIAEQYTSLAKFIKYHEIKYGEAVTELFHKEVNFIYLYLNRDSYAGYSDENKFKTLKKVLVLPTDWKIHKNLQLVIDDLKADFETPAEKSLRLSNKVLITFTDIMEKIIDDVNVTVAKIESKTKKKDLSEEEIKALQGEIKGIGDEMLKMLKVVSEIPKAIAENEKLTTKVKNEGSQNIAYGKKQIHDFERSNNVI